jgi:tRNA (guanine37-N1)-methyltransferase
MRFNLVSLFPEFFDSPLSSGLMARARQSGLVELVCSNPRDFATDKHRSVDDRPYGGGPGMVMLLETLDAALKSLDKPGKILLMSPSGRPFDQAMARDLAGEEALTLVCGRYEGVDERLMSLHDVTPLSVGDFVLNGGEAAAVCVVEAVARLLPGFMGHVGSGEDESFSAGLIEYAHYTRPENFQGLLAPEILLSGDHGRIGRWRREQSLAATLARRPELLETAPLDGKDFKVLRDLSAQGGRRRLGRNLHLALAHHPVLNKEGKTVAVSLTNLDVHDIARCSCAYGLGGYYISTPLADQQALARELVGHWLGEQGRAVNPDRAEALERVRVVDTLEQAVALTTEAAGRKPRVAATSAAVAEKSGPLLSVADLRGWLEESPVLLVLGTGHGLAPEVFETVDGTLRPIRPYEAYNHLSVRSAASIMLDRILGDAQ